MRRKAFRARSTKKRSGYVVPTLDELFEKSLEQVMAELEQALSVYNKPKEESQKITPFLEA